MQRAAIGLLLMSCGALAQTAGNRPSFEVASVKAVEAGKRGPGQLRGGPGTNSPGQLSGMATMKALLIWAYGMKPFQIGGPGWMETERYEIDAKIPAGSNWEQVTAMMRGLLAERFHLVAHTETKETPVYALVVGKGGAKLKESAADDNADGAGAAPKIVKGADGDPDLAAGTILARSYQVAIGGPDGVRYKLWARRESTAQLADRLSSQLNRPVVDETGHVAQYDFALTWTMESAGGGVPRNAFPPDMIENLSTPVLQDGGVSIFAAVQEQLGLRLESKKAPVEMLVVDGVERAPVRN